ncbi:ISPsy18, transposase, truncated [Pseudomonas savastanoi pv. glycinea str. B076]|nr:ISPsy18, transposase, truncated [Pseudomonas savastanoi pv. glycinea str. B076]EFW83328.1 ISPsy18, transposase, truncated [Pseudomonas savastanoi pv. glycinea str. race 4]
MPTKKKSANATARELPSIPQELIEQFVKGPMSAEAIQDASMAFKKALIERALVWCFTSTNENIVYAHLKPTRES